jgi:hypothetical protein
MSLEIVKDNSGRVFENIKGLTKKWVLVGVPSETSTRSPDDEDPNPDITNAEIGYLNETGEPEMNIPARPHLVPGVEQASPKVIARYKKAATSALDGDAAEMDKAHEFVGLLASDAVKDYIATGPFAPLSEATIKARARKGRTGTKPLIDTAQYLRSITYVVRKRDGN